jgi:hypothetical protein
MSAFTRARHFKPSESIPHPHTTAAKTQLNTELRYVCLPKCTFLWGFSNTFCVHFWYKFVLYAHLIVIYLAVGISDSQIIKLFKQLFFWLLFRPLIKSRRDLMILGSDCKPQRGQKNVYNTDRWTRDIKSRRDWNILFRTLFSNALTLI